VTIPNSVTSIGSSAFERCTGLTSVIIGNSVTSTGYYAFAYCSGLTSVTIPNSVTSIRDGAFAYCDGLTSIIVESENITYDSRNNCNAIIETSTNTLIQGCKTTTIPNSVTSIGKSAFLGCSDLTSIEIPNSVTNIESGAFTNCTSMTSITIPNSVTNIRFCAFYYCTSLISITCEATTPPTIEDEVFNDTNNCPIYVPTGTVNTYKAATKWSRYASRIQAIQ
jgi:hypothetical protein